MPAAVAVPLIAAAVGAGTTVYGAKSAGKSARRAQNIQSKSDDAAIQLERERDAEARRQWEAAQQFEAQKWNAQEEERIYNRRMQEEREARQAPYRAMSAAALGNLGSMLGLDLGSTPLAQNLSRPPTPPPPAPAPFKAPPYQGYQGNLGQITGLR